MYDNIGVQLLSVLYSFDQFCKDMMIWELFFDLCDIINDNFVVDLLLEEVVLDLWVEMVECCVVYDIQLDWSLQGEMGRVLFFMVLYVLRFVMCEIVSNMIKYVEVSMLFIVIVVDGCELNFVCQDNGKGFDLMIVKLGNGFENLQD